MREKLAARARGIQQSKIRAVTRRIEAVNGVNLGQGTCALPPCSEVLTAAHSAIDAGHNSYTLFDGIPALKEAVAKRYHDYNQVDIGPNNVLVTGGATGGLECVCKCFLEPGDEVILFEPIYQYHVKLIEERGAIARYVQLRPPTWRFDSGELEASFSNRTKLFVFANPNNPSGKVFSRDELESIGQACRRHDVIAVVDEVYEYIIGPDKEHVSLASLSEFFDNTLTLSSASKTLFVTGWRVGWIVGPEDVMEPLGVKSDETYVCAPAPFQHAVAAALGFGDEFFNSIRNPFNQRRDLLCSALSSANFSPYVPDGAYYVLADYTRLGYKSDIEAMNCLIDRAGIGSIPGSAFFPSQSDTCMLRFCYALTDDLVVRGCDLLTSAKLS